MRMRQLFFSVPAILGLFTAHVLGDGGGNDGGIVTPPPPGSRDVDGGIVSGPPPHHRDVDGGTIMSPPPSPRDVDGGIVSGPPPHHRDVGGGIITGPPPHHRDLACANPPMDQCAFYANCLETRYQCGPDGYPLGYGQFYCQKFSDNRGLLGAQGQEWMLATMHCLQLALVPDAIEATPPASDCEALKDQAFASHAGCYTNNGFCALGVDVWGAVLEIVNIKTLFSNWDAFKATIETAADCAEFYAYMMKRGLF